MEQTIGTIDGATKGGKLPYLFIQDKEQGDGAAMRQLSSLLVMWNGESSANAVVLQCIPVTPKSHKMRVCACVCGCCWAALLYNQHLGLTLKGSRLHLGCGINIRRIRAWEEDRIHTKYRPTCTYIHRHGDLTWWIARRRNTHAGDCASSGTSAPCGWMDVE